jgi:hypothetical protein
MKRLTSMLTALSLVALIAGVAIAQTGTTNAPTKPATKAERAAWANSQGLHDTRDIIGTRIKSTDGKDKDLGEIDALLVDPKDGKVTHAVIGLGGLFGIGEEKVVVKWSDIKMGAYQEGKKAEVAMDRAALESAPRYVKAKDKSAPAASPATSPRSDSRPVDKK